MVRERYDTIERIVGLQLSTASSFEIAMRIQGLGGTELLQLTRTLTRYVRSNSNWTDDDKRKGVSQLLVALAPATEGLISEILHWDPHDGRGELQFTLFCYLDDVPSIPGAQSTVDAVPRMVEEYLSNANASTALAPWMAGDLLGAHWDPKSSIPVLARVATKGRFSVGRLGAIHGLEEILPRVSVKQAQQVLRVVEEVTSKDRSKRVRMHAQVLLSEHARHGSEASKSGP